MFPLRLISTRLPRPLARAGSYALSGSRLLPLSELDRSLAGAMRRALEQGVCRGGKAAPEQTVFDA